MITQPIHVLPAFRGIEGVLWLSASLLPVYTSGRNQDVIGLGWADARRTKPITVYLCRAAGTYTPAHMLIKSHITCRTCLPQPPDDYQLPPAAPPSSCKSRHMNGEIVESSSRYAAPPPAGRPTSLTYRCGVSPGAAPASGTAGVVMVPVGR